MLRFLLRRLSLIPFALIAVNFIAFSYAHLALRYQQAQNPFGSDALEHTPPILTLYADYARGMLNGDFGMMPVGVTTPVSETVTQAAGASLGLLALVFVLSLLSGLALGLGAVRINPARVSAWLLPATALGLSLPGFYLGVLMVVASVYYVLNLGPDATPPLPLQGFGWDQHLLLPTLALMVRPTVQIAQVTASLLSDELGKQYVTAARSRGNTWARARWRHAFRNVLAPVILAIAGSVRLLVGELILVEWLFAWPGLGRFLTLTLVPPRIATVGGHADLTVYFLHPPLVAALLTTFTCLFLLVDIVASFTGRLTDPRLQIIDSH